MSENQHITKKNYLTLENSVQCLIFQILNQTRSDLPLLHTIGRHNQYKKMAKLHFCQGNSIRIITQANKINPSIVNVAVNFNCKLSSVACWYVVVLALTLSRRWRERKTNISNWVISLNNYTPGVLVINGPLTDCLTACIIFSSPPWLLHPQYSG